MSKYNRGILSGHIGSVVYRELNGRQIMQSMPSHYRDAKTESQLKQRSGMRNILATYRLLKNVLKSQFEATAYLQKRPYDCFKHHNLLLPAVDLTKKDYNMGLCIMAPYIVSFGKLPPLDISVVDNTLQFQMKSEDWKVGDVLRLIMIKSKASSESVPEPVTGVDRATDKPTYLSYINLDTFINKVEDKLIVSEPLTSGAYTYIHLRNTSKGWRCSTQRLILI